MTFDDLKDLEPGTILKSGDGSVEREFVALYNKRIVTYREGEGFDYWTEGQIYLWTIKKEKKKYWKWMYKNMYGNIIETREWYDENFFDSTGAKAPVYLTLAKDIRKLEHTLWEE